MPPSAIANFDDVDPACVPYEIQFRNTSRYGVTYLWDFGDGYTSNQRDPRHTYSDPGTYDVTLFVTGNSLDQSRITKQIVVHPMPQPNFNVVPNYMWVGQTARTINYTARTYPDGTPYEVWYEWDWGDGSDIVTDVNPSHMYLRTGFFDVTLTVGTYTEPQCVATLTLDEAIELDSSGDMILPNVFRPLRPGDHSQDGNGNGEGSDGEPSDIIPERGNRNFLFFPGLTSPMRAYHMVIYNRLGIMLYETHDPGRGWNGYYKGNLCEEGVYVYRIEGVFENGQPFLKVGDILLLR